jgi:hypothetical protein
MGNSLRTSSIMRPTIEHDTRHKSNRFHGNVK